MVNGWSYDFKPELTCFKKWTTTTQGQWIKLRKKWDVNNIALRINKKTVRQNRAFTNFFAVNKGFQFKRQTPTHNFPNFPIKYIVLSNTLTVSDQKLRTP